jgi:hypothetical protein
MKRIPFFSLFFCIALAGTTKSLSGQPAYFVYVQTADNTPFYIRMGSKVISSTAAGYLLVGKLADSLYPFQLGMVGNNEVQEYVLKVAGRDAGYIIKKAEGQRWSMTDLQTGQTQYSMEWQAAAEANDRKPREAAALAAKADTVVKVSPPLDTTQDMTLKNPANAETKVVEAAAIGGLAASSQAGTQASASRKPTLDMEFTMKTDTTVVRSDSAVAAPRIASNSDSTSKDSLALLSVASDEKLAGYKATDSTGQGFGTDSNAVKKESVSVLPKRTPCGSLTGRKEVDDLMTSAAMKTDVDERINVFVDGIRGHCITTSNIRKIAQSLASDVSRYKLLKAMYPFALDYYAYSELADLLTDKYYLAQFNQIIRQ